MRLLGWMNHRSHKASTEPFKDFTIGNYCACISAQSPLDDHISYPRPSLETRYRTGLSKQPNEECVNTSSENEAEQVDENYRDETSIAISELFHGFLAIGTLGSEPITSGPATPTFPTSLENIEKKIEVTENDLKIINNGLEKFLEAEAEEEECNESLARSSYVSTITLSGMQMEGSNTEGYGKTIVCPLQGYLFGSSIELPETRIGIKKEKVSLGEMFRRAKVTDEISAGNEVKGQMQAKKTHKSAKHLIKKILTKFLNSSGNPPPSPGDEATSTISTKKKLNKVLKMFHRKVHPENPMAEREFSKSQKDEKKLNDGGYGKDLMHHDKDKTMFFTGSKSMEEFRCHENKLKLPKEGPICSKPSANGEYWIKTDADYLVLEL